MFKSIKLTFCDKFEIAGFVVENLPHKGGLLSKVPPENNTVEVNLF